VATPITPVEVSGGTNLSMVISTLTFPAPGYALILVYSAAAPSGCSDPTNGTYTQLQQVASASRYLTLYGRTVIAGTPTITVTCGTANLLAVGGTFEAGYTYDVSGSVENSFLGTSGGANAIAGAASSLTSTGLDTVIAFFANDSTLNGTGALTVGSGYTQLTTAYDPIAGSAWLWQYINQGSAGAINPPAVVNGQCEVLAITVALSPVGASLGNHGTATINFGAYPGSNQASVTVAPVTTIGSSAQLEAWFMGTDSTVDHTANDHQYVPLFVELTCGNISVGSGFTIYATSTEYLHGTFNVNLVWA
jgi:hypothetical protein